MERRARTKGRLIVGKPGEKEIESVKGKRGKRGDRRQRKRDGVRQRADRDRNEREREMCRGKEDAANGRQR